MNSKQISAESQSRSQSGVKLAIKWNTSQNIKFGMKLSPMVWGIYMLNIRAQHYLHTEIFTFNKDMCRGVMYTSYWYTSIRNCAMVYHTICVLMKLSVFILSQVPNNTFWMKTHHYGFHKQYLYWVLVLYTMHWIACIKVPCISHHSIKNWQTNWPFLTLYFQKESYIGAMTV